MVGCHLPQGYLGLGRDLDGRSRYIIQLDQLWLTIDGHDLVAIDRGRLSSVVSHWNDWIGCSEVGIGVPGARYILELESLNKAQKIALDHRAIFQLGALDGKPEKPLELRLLSLDEVPRERDDVQYTDGTNG